MSIWTTRTVSGGRGLLSLVALFIVWKAFLLAIVSLSPWPGYDSSSVHLLVESGKDIATHGAPLAGNDDCIGQIGHQQTSAHLSQWSRWLLRFFRWDVVYFTDLAQNGYRYEQQWAFTWGFMLRHVTKVFRPSPSSIVDFIWSGLIVTNGSHLLSVFSLYYLTLTLLRSTNRRGSESIAFTAAALHILSPAGIFLTAPYGESPFAFLQFTSLCFYAHSLYPANTSASAGFKHLWILPSALLLSVAVLVRSNGLLTGPIYLLDLLSTAWPLLHLLPPLRPLLAVTNKIPFFSSLLWRRPIPHPLFRASVLIPSGILVLLTFAYPQLLAWRQFCDVAPAIPRPWCTRLPPSIYAFVQAEYWDVGFLRYWTLGNLPLFVMAAPALVLLIKSSVAALRGELVLDAPSAAGEADTASSKRRAVADEKEAQAVLDECSAYQQMMLARLAVPQLLLALTAVTSYHVQIVLRLCSGYPLWDVAVALAIEGRWQVAFTLPLTTRKVIVAPKAIVMWMIVYAGVQAGLYGAFLPPA